MKTFISLLRRFVWPYKRYVVLNVVANLLATLFSLFSFATIIPMLQILFGLSKPEATYQPIPWSGGFKAIADAAKDDVYYFLNHTMETTGAGHVLFYLCLFLVITALLKTFFSFVGAYSMIPIHSGVLRDLRKQIYEKIIALPIGFFSQERKGDILARMTGDVVEVGNSITSSLNMLFKNPIMILIYLGTMFVMSYRLTLFVLILLPASGYLIGRVGRSLKTRSSRVQSQIGEMLSQVEETISGLRIIKAFVAEKKVAQRFSEVNETNRRTVLRMNGRYELAHPMSEFLGTVVISIILWYGGTLILDNQSSINAASFIYYMVIFYSIINPLKDLSKAMYSIQKGKASLERIDRILMAENTLPDPKNPQPLTQFKDAIAYKSVSFSYNEDRPVLRNVSLTIPRGHTVALVGQSGSGKTTLADLLPRYYDVKGGGIEIDGIDVRNVSHTDLRSLMGIVSQEPILFNDTFFNNIAFGVEHATMEDVIAAAKIANAHEFIMAIPEGYDTKVGDRGCLLSGGQRQRISIARAVLKNPPILILDEATSALDTESERFVQEAIEHLMKNRTTLVIAHRLSTIKNADMICVMHEGQIVEQGTHDELIAKDGYYRRLNEMQS